VFEYSVSQWECQESNITIPSGRVPVRLHLWWQACNQFSPQPLWETFSRVIFTTTTQAEQWLEPSKMIKCQPRSPSYQMLNLINYIRQQTRHRSKVKT